MKKNILLILFLIFTLTLVGCTQNKISIQEIKDKEEKFTISDYYPFMENTYYEYEGIGNELAEQGAFTEYIEGNRAQIKVLNPGTTIVKVMEIKENTLSEIYYEAEFYHIENMINNNNEKRDILLKEPFELGNSWSDPEGHKRSITAIDIDIDTPYEKFQAIEVTTELGEGNTSKRYYSKNIGLVASIYEDQNGEIKTLLKSIKKMPLDFEVLTYYSLKSEIRTVSVPNKIVFNTNEKVEKIIEKIMKNPPSDNLIPNISSGTIINSISMDRIKWVLKVDFSKELLSEVNIGSSQETEMLKSIVNTLGKFFQTEEVYISIEGKPYESGHYALKEGETFIVDLENIEDF